MGQKEFYDVIAPGRCNDRGHQRRYQGRRGRVCLVLHSGNALKSGEGSERGARLNGALEGNTQAQAIRCARDRRRGLKAPGGGKVQTRKKLPLQMRGKGKKEG